MDTAIFKLLGNLAGKEGMKKYSKEYQNTELHSASNVFLITMMLLWLKYIDINQCRIV